MSSKLFGREIVGFNAAGTKVAAVHTVSHLELFDVLANVKWWCFLSIAIFPFERTYIIVAEGPRS